VNTFILSKSHMASLDSKSRAFHHYAIIFNSMDRSVIKLYESVVVKLKKIAFILLQLFESGFFWAASGCPSYRSRYAFLIHFHKSYSFK